MLSPKTIQVIKSITPAVAANAETITTNFYERMFRDNPEVRGFFNQAHQHAGSQQKALAGAIAAYFAHIENPAVLMPAIEVIAQKHSSLQVKPEHYPIVGRHLLDAIKDVFGEAANDEVLTAVGEAYGFLASVCTAREKEIYSEQENQSGGWSGFRDFKVTKKVPESEIITSFYLEPVDGRPLPNFKPGQYTAVRLTNTPSHTSPRNYSLSDAPGAPHFRISVKREATANAPCGIVSNCLHDNIEVGDHVQLAPPAGDFYFDSHKVGDAPVVFLAGGIGVTPLLSMAKSFVRQNAGNTCHFLLASLSSSTVAFSNELKDLSKSKSNFNTLVFFDEPKVDDLAEQRCDHLGRINRAVLSDFPNDTAHFFICGPKQFMHGVIADLLSLGVSNERIQFEFFGPALPIS